MDDTACAFCGKAVLPGPCDARVHEGDKLYHLDCYVTYRRQLPPASPRP